MKRKVIFNHSILENKNLKSLMLRDLPKSLRRDLMRRSTSLGDNKIFPPEDDVYFDEKITNKRLNTLIDRLENYSEITDYSLDGLNNKLTKLIIDCKEIERPVRQQIEAVCYNAIDELFNTSTEMIDFKCNIVDKVTCDDGLRVKSISTDDFSFNDIKEAEELRDEVYKRRVINCLTVGASIYFTEKFPKIFKNYIADIFNIDNRLPQIYAQIIIINDYLLFMNDELKLDDENKMQGSSAKVVLDNGTNKAKITVQGVIFPLLFAESVKGFMEFFSAQGLPNDINKTKYILSRADYLLAEPWDMRLGPGLFDYLIKELGDEHMYLPQLFIYISKLTLDEFNSTLREIFGNTKIGKEKIAKIISDIKHDAEYQDFSNKLSAKQNYNDMLFDDYLSEDELKCEEINEYSEIN